MSISSDFLFPVDIFFTVICVLQWSKTSGKWVKWMCDPRWTDPDWIDSVQSVESPWLWSVGCSIQLFQL